jgi:RimJ/RimL family protein N-acetyltransferase
MIEQGLILPISDWTDNRCGLIYGKVQGKVISFILYDLDYDLQKRNQTLLISKTFVDQKYRQKKIYSNMQTLLINYSRDLGYMNIATIVNKNNIGYIECIEKLGLAFICYKTWKEIS